MSALTPTLAVTVKAPYGMSRKGALVHRPKCAIGHMRDGRVGYYATWQCTNSTSDAAFLAEVGDRDMCTVCKYALRPVVYRFFNIGLRVIYIGATDSYVAREQQHAREQDWWPEVASVRLERLATFSDALVAERRAIRAEHPIHNVTHRVKVRAA